MTGLRALAASTRGRLVVLGLGLLVVVSAVIVQLAQPAPAVPVGTDGDGERPPPAPLIVSVARVRSAGDVKPSVHVPLTVSAHALGEAGVVALELWDGGSLAAVERASGDSTSPAFYARWEWTPETPGEHILFVRAVDRMGRAAQSSAVRLTVDEPAVSVIGSGIFGRPIAMAGSEWLVGSRGRYQAAAAGLSLPAVQASQIGCQLNLAVAQLAAEATGIGIYGLSPSGSSFISLAAGPKSTSDNLSVQLAGSGKYLFTASAYSGQVEAYSAPVEVVAPAECSSGGWNGKVSLNNGLLVTDQQLERAYIYLTQAAGAAVRLPSAAGQFVTPDAAGAFDFGSLLPPLEGSPYEIEAWGWKDGALVEVGRGTYTPPPPKAGTGGPLLFGGDAAVAGGDVQLAAGAVTKLQVINRIVVTPFLAPGQCSKEFCYVDEPSAAGVIERPVAGATAPIIRRFQWSTAATNVTQLVWQILPYPPANSPDLAPPFLMDQGVVAVPAAQSSGEFTIDFAKYLGSGIATAATGQLSTEQLAHLPLAGWAGAELGPTPTPVGAKDKTAAIKVALQNFMSFNNRFYVRVVPLQFNSAIFPSAAVTLDVVDPPNVVSVDPGALQGYNQNAYTIDWTYTPPLAAEAKYSRCAIVTGFTSQYLAFGNPWHAQHQASYSKQTPICYTPPKDSGWSPFDVFDAFVEFVADVWDYVADGYSWIKQKVVELALKAIPCDQIASKSTCETIASTALDMAIAAFTGMPPSLPNFETAMAGLKGDLATFIVESAGAIPGVAQACGIADAAQVVSSKLKNCEELAGIAVDAAIEQVIAARSTAAGKATGKGWPGVLWKPDPRGLYHPPAFQMTVTRTADPVLPASCTVQAAAQSKKKAWTFPELHQGYPKQITADVSGQPLLSSSFVLPPLETGETMSHTLYAGQPVKWFESQRAEMYWNYYEAMLNVTSFTRAWVLLTHGAELTFHVNSNCAKPSQQGPYVMTESAWDQ
jgi:hypothetical protein